MAIKGLHLAWIVVSDVKKAIKFYTETVGMKLNSFEEKFGWAELSGQEGGAVLGIAQQSDHEAILPGQNAVITLSVENIQKAKAELEKKGATMKGEIMDIPGIVKLQMVVDQDGNHFQLVESAPGQKK